VNHMNSRVLLVTDYYPPLIGGATRSAQLIARALARRGYQVSVATTWQPGTPLTEQDEDGVGVHRLRGLTMRMTRLSANPYRRVPPPFPDPELVWRLRRLIRRIRPDVVHSSGWLSYSCAVALLGNDVPLILGGRDYGNVCAVGSLVRDGVLCEGPGLSKCLACAADHYGAVKGTLAVAGVLGGRPLLRSKIRAVQSVSTYVEEILGRHLVRTEGDGSRDRRLMKMVIPDFRLEGNGDAVDEQVLARLPRQPFILFVGALREIKGIRVLVEAYERLDARPPLVVLGSRAPDMPTSFPDDVVVEYDVSHSTVMAAWDRALFGVAPSVLPEPLGNVVHEAMSRGKTVVGTTPGGHAEMIHHGVDGLLVRAGDVDALAAAMRLLLDDAALRSRLERAATASAERFTPEVQIPRFDALMRKLISATAAATR